MRITRLEEVIGQGVFLRTRTARNEKLSRHLAFSGECEAASSLVARLRPDSFVEVSVLSSCLAAERVALTTEAVVKRGRGFDLRKNLTGPGRGWSDRSSSSWYDAPQNDVRHVREPGLPCGVFTSPCRLSSPRSGKRDVEPLSGDLLCRASFEDGGLSHSYFRTDGLNATGYIDDYTYAKAAKQSSKVRRSCRVEFHAMRYCDLSDSFKSSTVRRKVSLIPCDQSAVAI